MHRCNDMTVAFWLALFGTCWCSLSLGAPRELLDSDFILVRASCSNRLNLAQATARAGRNTTELRVVYVMEDERLARKLHNRHSDSMNETYLYWPDRPDARKPGDTRVAMAPWLAHRALGDSYRWMLYGDDDTYFFLNSVKELLRDYDPDLPYVVTDVLWHKRKRYMMEAPRCLPCHVTPAYRAMAAARPDRNPPYTKPGTQPSYHFHQPPVPPAGCPCTPALACEYTLNVTGEREALQRKVPLRWSPESKAWGLPRRYPSVCDYPHFHGGSGVLISVGAMRKISFDAALECFYDDIEQLTAKPKTLKADAHGDRMTSLCFWMHGIATTDPGLSLSQHELSDIASRVMDSRTANAKALQEVIYNNVVLSPEWFWSVLHMAASHVGHRNGSVKATYKLTKLYQRARVAAIESLRKRGESVRGELDLQLQATFTSKAT